MISGCGHCEQIVAWVPYMKHLMVVHIGDVTGEFIRPPAPAIVPIPGAAWLFGSCLIGLLSFNRRKNKTVNLIAA